MKILKLLKHLGKSAIFASMIGTFSQVNARSTMLNDSPWAIDAMYLSCGGKTLIPLIRNPQVAAFPSHARVMTMIPPYQFCPTPELYIGASEAGATSTGQFFKITLSNDVYANTPIQNWQIVSIDGNVGIQSTTTKKEIASTSSGILLAPNISTVIDSQQFGYCPQGQKFVAGFEQCMTSQQAAQAMQKQFKDTVGCINSGGMFYVKSKQCACPPGFQFNDSKCTAISALTGSKTIPLSSVQAAACTKSGGTVKTFMIGNPVSRYSDNKIKVPQLNELQKVQLCDCPSGQGIDPETNTCIATDSLWQKGYYPTCITGKHGGHDYNGGCLSSNDCIGTCHQETGSSFGTILGSGLTGKSTSWCVSEGDHCKDKDSYIWWNNLVKTSH